MAGNTSGVPFLAGVPFFLPFFWLLCHLIPLYWKRRSGGLNGLEDLMAARKARSLPGAKLIEASEQPNKTWSIFRLHFFFATGVQQGFVAINLNNKISLIMFTSFMAPIKLYIWSMGNVSSILGLAQSCTMSNLFHGAIHSN